MSRFSSRPWGWHLTLIDRTHFKVKILRFRKHEAISHQKHKYRSELWLFLSGEGALKIDDYWYSCAKGDSFLIAKNKWHQYQATTPTFVLEIQYGEKCDEEDITRL